MTVNNFDGTFYWVKNTDYSSVYVITYKSDVSSIKEKNKRFEIRKRRPLHFPRACSADPTGAERAGSRCLETKGGGPWERERTPSEEHQRSPFNHRLQIQKGRRSQPVNKSYLIFPAAWIFEYSFFFFLLLYLKKRLSIYSRVQEVWSPEV